MIDDSVFGTVPLRDGPRVSAVEAAVRAAAAAEITPRFRQLAAHEIVEKNGPHDLVTVADRGAEAHLTAALTALLPGSVVVGEEAVHADPAVYKELRGEAPVWIVDPVDGTRQFVRGEPGFCSLVALAWGGEVLASWTYAPVLDEMAVAVRGRGRPAERRTAAVRLARARRGAHGGHVAPGLHDGRPEARPARAAHRRRRRRPCGSAGLEYLAVARGALDAVAFNWEFAWDHAAGLLLVKEAGGAELTLSGEPFRITGGNALPFTAARDEATARRIREHLLT